MITESLPFPNTPLDLAHSYYRFVPGQEQFPTSLYQEVARQCDDSDVLVEVGAGFGRSTSLMCELLAHYNKHPKFFVIDTFGTVPAPDDGGPLKGETPWNEPWEKWAERVGGTNRMIDQFLFYLDNCPAKDRLTDWEQMPAWHSAGEFKNESLHFVFLNSRGGVEQQVNKQIEEWLPKIKMGGCLGVYGGAIRNSMVMDGASPDDGYSLVIRKTA